MKKFSITLGCAVFLVSSFSGLSFAKIAGTNSRLDGAGGIPIRHGQTGNRLTAAPLFNLTHAGSNMVRLGGAPRLSPGAAAISGAKQHPSSRISGQEFSHTVGSR